VDAPDAWADVVEEIVPLGGLSLSILRPRDSEALLDEGAFEQEEFLPYWADLWPSAAGLARALAGRSLRGARTLELGCGLGLPAVVAALAGGRVLATDWAPAAIEFARENARRNDAQVEVLRCSWAEPAELVERAPWDLVIAADVLYESRNVDQLLPLLPRADPGRVAAERFLAEAAERWDISTRRDTVHDAVRIHRMRLVA
jgi:SAM-dependent methyltransferase